MTSLFVVERHVNFNSLGSRKERCLLIVRVKVSLSAEDKYSASTGTSRKTKPNLMPLY